MNRQICVGKGSLGRRNSISSGQEGKMAASVELQGPMALYVCSSSSERMSVCKGVEYERQS